ncbi:hypothetical protein ACJX0J_038590 [Zea mays]
MPFVGMTTNGLGFYISQEVGRAYTFSGAKNEFVWCWGETLFKKNLGGSGIIIAENGFYGKHLEENIQIVPLDNKEDGVLMQDSQGSDNFTATVSNDKNNQDERPTQIKELVPVIEDEEMKKFGFNKPGRGKKNLINKSKGKRREALSLLGIIGLQYPTISFLLHAQNLSHDDKLYGDLQDIYKKNIWNTKKWYDLNNIFQDIPLVHSSKFRSSLQHGVANNSQEISA